MRVTLQGSIFRNRSVLLNSLLSLSIPQVGIGPFKSLLWVGLAFRLLKDDALCTIYQFHHQEIFKQHICPQRQNQAMSPVQEHGSQSAHGVGTSGNSCLQFFPRWKSPKLSVKDGTAGQEWTTRFSSRRPRSGHTQSPQVALLPQQSQGPGTSHLAQESPRGTDRPVAPNPSFQQRTCPHPCTPAT